MSLLSLDIHHLELLLFVGGVSGAGKSKSMDVLSDLGFFNIENLPVPLLPDFIQFTASNPARYTRLVALPDISSSGRLNDFIEILNRTTPKKGKLFMIYLDCSTEVLVRRFNETRRPHPSFDPERDQTLEDTIEREKGRLLPFKERADLLIDTTNFTIHQLKDELTTFIESISNKKEYKLRLNFLSFGYKFGIPADCDLVMDVRFLPNPYFVDYLRSKDGTDPEVASYVLSSPTCKDFLDQYQALLLHLIPQYIKAGKPYLNVGIGCTGGKHRSVAIADKLYSLFQGADYFVSAKHRDKSR